MGVASRLALGLAIAALVARAAIEILRILSATSGNVPLATAYLINTVSVVAGVTVLVVALRWLGGAQTTARTRALNHRRDAGDVLVAVGKDQSTLDALRKVIPDAPEDFWRAGSRNFYFTIAASPQDVQFWVGGKQLFLAASVPRGTVAVPAVELSLADARLSGRGVQPRTEPPC